MTLQLPQKLLTFGAGDKGWRERWTPDRDLLNIPASFRCILVGRPNSGKSTSVLNILLRAKPAFEKIYLLHCDKHSKDYEDIEVEKLDKMPGVDTFDYKTKKALIIDDYPFSDMKKDEKQRFSILFRYISSHKNLSIFLTSQNLYSIPIIARRTSNFFIVWRSPDMSYIKTMSKRCGLNPKKFMKLLDEYLHDYYDSVWLDFTLNSRAQIRINGYEVIDPNDL